jgi:archaellum component FlaC
MTRHYDTSERHKSWSNDAEHELRRIVGELRAEIKDLERQLRAAKAEIRELKRPPAASVPVLAMRTGGAK